MKHIITLLLFASTAFAETPVDIVAINGDHALTTQRIMHLWQRVERRFSRAGAPVYLRELRRIDEPSDSLSLGYSNMVARLDDYRPYANPNYKTIFIVPPIQQDGKLWLTGVAEIGCHNTIGWAAAEEANQDGAPRFLVSVLAVQHELLHGFSATHTEFNPSVMWPDALSLLVQGWKLRVIRKTKNELARCNYRSASSRHLDVLPVIN